MSAAKPNNPVAMRHASAPGEVHVVDREAFDLCWAPQGWVEAKSPAAKAAVEEAEPAPSRQRRKPSSKKNTTESPSASTHEEK